MYTSDQKFGESIHQGCNKLIKGNIYNVTKDFGFT